MVLLQGVGSAGVHPGEIRTPMEPTIWPCGQNQCAACAPLRAQCERHSALPRIEVWLQDELPSGLRGVWEGPPNEETASPAEATGRREQPKGLVPRCPVETREHTSQVLVVQLPTGVDVKVEPATTQC